MIGPSRRMFGLSGVYLAPALLNMLLWVGQPALTVLDFMFVSGCGPLSIILLLVPISWALRFPGALAPVLFGCIWTTWFIALRHRRFRNLRYGAHAVIALLWWLVGTLFVMVGIAT
jgi:hypothetical protein